MKDKKKTKILAFRSILIYGMGMMGTSLAIALRKQSPNIYITCVLRSKKQEKYIRSLNIIDEVLFKPTIDIDKLPYLYYDLIIFSLNIGKLLKIIPSLPPIKAVITDISSTQSQIASAFSKRPDLCFINSHPLCGSEQSGPEAAITNLFKNRLCLLSAPYQRQKELNLLKSFWESIGMDTHLTDANNHDLVLSYLSHTPHILSSILPYWVQEDKNVRDMIKKTKIMPSGGGLRDMIRIAGSNPEMWVDILETNKDNIIMALEAFEMNLSMVIKSLKIKKRSYWLMWFKNARKKRDRLYFED